MKFSPKLFPGFRHLPRFIRHRPPPGGLTRGIFSERYAAHPMSEAKVGAHLAPDRRPDIDAVVRPLSCRMAQPEAMRLSRGVYRRRRLAVADLAIDWFERAAGRCSPLTLPLNASEHSCTS